jgi:hypothetical protein
MENKADIDAIRADISTNFFSPLDAVELDFTPVAIKACCWYDSNPPTVMIDGSTGGSYWDWGWGGSSGNGSDYFEPPETVISANNGVGHISGHTNALTTPAHFFTVDLGEIKTNIWRVAYYSRDATGTDNRIPATWEIWISDDPISADPETNGDAVKAAAGTWTAAAVSGGWRIINFMEEPLSNSLVSARYIQLRSLSDPDGGTFEIGGREFKVDILGDFDGNIDSSSLEEAYHKGLQILPLLEKKAPALKIKLEPLLYGEFDPEDGQLLARGAKQLLELEPPDTMVISDQIERQQLLDTMTKDIREIISAYYLAHN